MLRHYAILAAAGLGMVLLAPVPAISQGRRMGGAHRPTPSARPPKTERIPAQKTAIDEFERMSPAQRDKTLAKLPADRAEKIRKQLETFDKLTPEQRSAVRQQLDMFRQLPPEKQQALRKAFDNFAKEPPDRQQLMRDELNQLRATPKEQRQAHVDNPEFRQRFNKREQKILDQMSSVLPE